MPEQDADVLEVLIGQMAECGDYIWALSLHREIFTVDSDQARQRAEEASKKNSARRMVERR